MTEIEATVRNNKRVYKSAVKDKLMQKLNVFRPKPIVFPTKNNSEKKAPQQRNSVAVCGPRVASGSVLTVLSRNQEMT